ncbi:MAG TPA: hypothetical protein VMV31_04970 [Terriglobales bacterium]|nr:hypothetical protein [Terriglobales bacterium]
MEHLDAKAIRERLNTIMLALTTLEHCSQHPRHHELGEAGRVALQEIAVLVTDDELEEHGSEPVGGLRRARQHIRAAESGQ